jgi:hypothetical protein
MFRKIYRVNRLCIIYSVRLINVMLAVWIYVTISYIGLSVQNVVTQGNNNERNVKYLNRRDGFGGLVVSILAYGSRVRGFDPDRSRWIFSDVKISSACLPSEGK